MQASEPALIHNLFKAGKRFHYGEIMAYNKLIIGICLIILNIGFADAATLNVGQGQTYTTVQSAIDAASPGDVILVNEGTYIENLVIKKNGISILGKNKEKTVIDGKKTGSGIRIDGSNNVVISGLTVTNSGGSGKEDAGISIYSANNNKIANVILVNNVVGISIYSKSNSNIISGNDIKSNSNNGIFIYDSNDNRIDNNNIQNNKFGIYADSARNNHIYSNNFIDNTNQAYDNSGLNSWDDGRSGNYWSPNKDILGGKVKDNYPLSSAVAIKYEEMPAPAAQNTQGTTSGGTGKSSPGFAGFAVIVSLIAIGILSKKK